MKNNKNKTKNNICNSKGPKVPQNPFKFMMSSQNLSYNHKNL